MRLMKLMYTGHSRNGKIVPPRLISAHSGHSELVRDHRQQRHRVRLAERQRLQRAG